MSLSRTLSFLVIIAAFPFGVYHGLKRTDTALFVYKSIQQLNPSRPPDIPALSQEKIQHLSLLIRTRGQQPPDKPERSSFPATAPQLLATRNSFDFRNIQVHHITSPQSFSGLYSDMHYYRLRYQNSINSTRSFWFSCRKKLTNSQKLLMVLPGSGEGEYLKILRGTSHYQSNYQELFGSHYNLCVLPRPSVSLGTDGNDLSSIHNLYQLNFIERGTTESVIHLNDLLAIVHSINKYYSRTSISLAGISAGGRLVFAASLINDPVMDLVDFHSFSGFSLLHLFFDEPMDINQPIIPGLYQPFFSTLSQARLSRNVSLYYGLKEDDLYGIEAKHSFTCREASRLFSTLRCFVHTGGHLVPRHVILKH